MTISTAATFDTLALELLQSRLSGELLQPQSPDYATARRLNNQRFDHRPALIVRCRNARDVVHAVEFARTYGLPLAIRSGGHSVPGHSGCDNGLVIDLSQMRAIAIDPERRIARVQPGATNGELVLACQAHGLATTTGTCATVGMGGSTLGGGIGWLMGRFGATVDNVLAFELVTADGIRLTASADEHPDLFWALRGGGGNFGVVTSITYRLHPLRQVLGGMVLFHQAAAPLALRMYHELTSKAPDELIAHAVLASVPDFGPALVVQACYSGEDLAEGERVLAPLRHFGPPAVDLIAPRSYAELYMLLTPPPMPGLAYDECAFTLCRPSDAALDTLATLAADQPAPFSMINMHQVHGAATRVPADATAFALREPHYAVVAGAGWMEGAGEAQRAWVERTREQMRPFAGSGLYVNFLGDDGEQAIRDAYRANYDRLAAVKQRYDPDNVFCLNQNIRPGRKG